MYSVNNLWNCTQELGLVTRKWLLSRWNVGKKGRRKPNISLKAELDSWKRPGSRWLCICFASWPSSWNVIFFKADFVLKFLTLYSILLLIQHRIKCNRKSEGNTHEGGGDFIHYVALQKLYHIIKCGIFSYKGVS